MSREDRVACWTKAMKKGLENEWDAVFGYEDEMYEMPDEQFTFLFTVFVLENF